jgi:hypothetical protein
MIEILKMQPPTSFEMMKLITTVTAKFMLIVEGQKMKREGWCGQKQKSRIQEWLT